MNWYEKTAARFLALAVAIGLVGVVVGVFSGGW